MKYTVSFFVNEEPFTLEVKANDTLLRVLREELDFTGTKEGCGAGECGACTVLIDGNPVNACMVLAAEMEGMHITTVEGLAKDGKLSPLQESFIDHAALQCGFCTPGFLMMATAFLRDNPHPTRQEITEAIGGNLCRCTGYRRIIEAIEYVASHYEGGERA